MMSSILGFVKRETVLVVAWALALVSIILVHPDGRYLSYIDFHTLALLFALMAVMTGLRGLGVFGRLGRLVLSRTASTRQLEGVLLFLPFFTSMAVTNDVALITFVPFALEVLELVDRRDRIIPVVSMQTIAANLGSMATPIGNPQNLYLYAHYGLSPADFFQLILPLTLASALLLGLWLAVSPSQPLAEVPRLEGDGPQGRQSLLWGYGALFILCLGAVGDLIPVWLPCAGALLFTAFLDRQVLPRVDYALLLTFVGFFLFVGNLGRLEAFHALVEHVLYHFVGFFLFVGNLGRLEAFHALVEHVLYHHEVVCAILASQVISNVPAALLLSGFTDNGRALLVGTNLGGLGTLIASMASLISYKYVVRALPGKKGRYLLWFTAANVLFLVILFGLYSLLF